ncbi:unnamed protein product [Schistosoma curassoni]|uniref:Transmembrane protein n=1 Tax=Schistosoma curassoni TaxID=6186 RepID=A0A183K170_9TREM|nr:unnamed protein product [Schistosoma curassoni]
MFDVCTYFNVDNLDSTKYGLSLLAYQRFYKMLVGGSQQETLDPGFVLFGIHQHGVPVILKKLVLPNGFGPVSPSFTIKDVTTGL